MNDGSSVISSLIDDEIKSQSSQSDTKAILLGLLAQLVWAFLGVQLKTFFRFFPEDFTNSSLTFYRSIALLSLGYYFAKKNNIEITPISQIQNKFWFYVRNVGIFFSLLLWVTMNQFLRLSTCQCISGCSPVIVLYLSVFILKEKFFMRYIAGILFCLFGTAIIVLNEKKPDGDADIPSSPLQENNVTKGILISIVHLFLSSAATFAQKYLINDKMSSEVQSFYLGYFQFGLGFLAMVVTNHYGINILYILYAFLNGSLVHLGIHISTESLKLIPISKFMPITYVLTVYIFILGYLILGEPIYFTDLVGGSLIIGFQLYNIWFPLR